MDWYQEVKNSSNRQTVIFLPIDPRDEGHQDLQWTSSHVAGSVSEGWSWGLSFFAIYTQFAMRHFDFHGAKNVFVHSRNFGSIELDVALHKLKVQHCCLARKSWNRRPRYKRLWCGLWNLVHLFRHKTRLCVWQNHSLFCHFNPFAFLHLICDGALICSSIHLLWKQYHRNQEVGRLGHVHGNDLEKHIFCLVKFCITEVLLDFFHLPVVPFLIVRLLRWFGSWKQHRGAENPIVRLFDNALEGSRRVQVRFPQSVVSQFPSNFKKPYKQIPAEPIWQVLM